MKKVLVIAGITAITGLVVSCSNVQREPGRVYMPDMAYSRAYETYADNSFLAKEGIHYNAKPVTGTVARGDLPEFPIPMDKQGDTVNYVAAKAVKSPLGPLTADEMKEAERLYLVNCGICHGPKLDGNGPLWKDGNGPYPAAPKNLVGDPVVSKMPEGQMFYSVTYGKNLMGSYASQLNTRQRWMVIAYVKSKQPGGTTNPVAENAGSSATK
ncbi:MAG TPA: c-type cytochrome [Chitinophagaceae bacterium]|jgi:mono/diheme cytochrome c family protein|nr:c-type cytochrome [Chitinophagaceae bacterium]